MSKKITYLLGAGASANAIPVVAYMNKRILEIISYIEARGNSRVVKECLTTLGVEINDYDRLFKDITEELRWLQQESVDYYSIDTLAKRYYLTEDDRYMRLKKALILYFTFEQYLNVFAQNDANEYQFKKSQIDKRYGNFIAAIANKKYPISGSNHNGLDASSLGFELNRNVKILSWNYDVQFELSLKQFTGTIIQHLKPNFQIFPHRKVLYDTNRVAFDTGRFGMVKLNGDAVWHRLIDYKYNCSILDATQAKNEDELLAEFIKEYRHSDLRLDKGEHIRPHHYFNFAWEADPNFRGKYQQHSENLEMAQKIARETQVLVVIGYSFPIFNRLIDGKLFEQMEDLEKVYVQDPNPDKIKSTMLNAFERLQKQVVVNSIGNPIGDYLGDSPGVKLRDKVTFQLEANTGQFIVPFELNLD